MKKLGMDFQIVLHQNKLMILLFHNLKKKVVINYILWKAETEAGGAVFQPHVPSRSTPGQL